MKCRTVAELYFLQNDAGKLLALLAVAQYSFCSINTEIKKGSRGVCVTDGNRAGVATADIKHNNGMDQSALANRLPSAYYFFSVGASAKGQFRLRSKYIFYIT